MMKPYSPILVGAAVLLTVATVAEAKAKYVADVNAQYPAAKASCVTCHVSPKPTKSDRALNGFGTDVKEKAIVRDGAGKKALDLSKIEALDSDRDGRANGDELKSGTNPGDPASK
jgi:hypothetical protein